MAIALAAPLALGGCMGWFIPDIDDIRLERVEVVSASEAGRCEEDASPRFCSIRPRTGELIRVTLSTSRDIMGTASRFEMNPGADASRCPFRSIYYGEIGVAGLFRKDVQLRQTSGGKADRYYALTGGRPSGRHEYQVYLRPDRTYTNTPTPGPKPDPNAPPLYDLRLHPEAVCIRVEAGNMAAQRMISKPFEVPADRIRAAFAARDAAAPLT